MSLPNLRGSMRRESTSSPSFSPRLALALSLLLVTASPLLSQVTTGKIQGRVTDAATGAPISGAQLLVDGTTLGNLTNDQGFYFVNEVPAGLQSVRAQFIGYRAFVIEGQRILAGQTTTLNFELEQTTIELTAISVEGERNPLVPRDQVATKSIVQGALVDQLPVDNVSEIVILQPGVYEEYCNQDSGGTLPANRCRTIRGGRPNEEAVYIDGVLVRSFGSGAAEGATVPTNSLEQVDVTVGGFSAEFGHAQSGVISYVTRSGGRRFTGALEIMTDQLAPDSYRTNWNRFELNLGGPIYGPLSFFVAGSMTGSDQSKDDGFPRVWVADGVDTCPDAPQYASLCNPGEQVSFRMPRSSSTSGAVDSVDVSAPRFVPWDNGRTFPYHWRDNGLFTGNLNLQLPRGSRLNLAYTRNRNQNYGRDPFHWTIYNPDVVNGFRREADIFTLGGFFTITQSATQQLSLDVRGSYQVMSERAGAVDKTWYLDHQEPFAGVTFSDVRFSVSEDMNRMGLDIFHPTEEYINAFRSGAIPADSTIVYPGRTELWGPFQTLRGLSDILRANPYAWNTTYGITGQGNTALMVRDEKQLQVRASLDWQIGRFNRVKLGGEYFRTDLSSVQNRMWFGRAVPDLASPVMAGAFLQDRLDVGDLVLEAGIRMDYVDPKVEMPRTAGFVFNVPDSLKAGFVKWDASTESFVPSFDEPCGGVSASNPNGTCLENFIETQSKTEWSPRLGASFPVTPTSTFRLSYGRFVQVPAFFHTSAAGTTGLLRRNNVDLVDVGGVSRSRDVDLPSTRTFEFGFRQLIGQDFVIDLSAFNKKQRGSLTYRLLPFEDPNNPGFFQNISVLTNDDFTESTGFEVKVDKAISNLFLGNLSYSYLDARGTGSDPWTYWRLIANQQTNLSFLTGEPVDPPEVLLPLELGRRHNISLTSSLVFPRDYLAGTTAGAILRDFGVFAILVIRSGQRYTKLENTGGAGFAPPSIAGISETSIGALETPWQTRIDLRFTKSFPVGKGWSIQAFVDLRNPFNLSATNRVFAETGNVVNEKARNDWMTVALADPRLDGDTEIRDFDIVAESPDIDFNKYMLLRAEERYGNGDGIFTVEEQELSFGQDWEAWRGRYLLVDSNQNLRLGFRIAF